MPGIKGYPGGDGRNGQRGEKGLRGTGGRQGPPGDFRYLTELEKDAEDVMEDDAEKPEEEEELKPLPNILSMIASSLNKETSKQPASQETAKVSVGRVSSFKEPEAPPNSVERVDRNLIEYEDDDFLSTNNDTEDIELF